MDNVYGYLVDPRTRTESDGSVTDLMALDPSYATALQPNLPTVTTGDVDLSKFCVMQNQLRLNSCTGNGTAESVEILNNIAGYQPVPYSGSCSNLIMSFYSIRGCAGVSKRRSPGSKPPARRCERGVSLSRGTRSATCPKSLSQQGFHCGWVIVETDLFVLGTSESNKKLRSFGSSANLPERKALVKHLDHLL
jgi:hypothetical protein